jgi:hypothetical protein
MSLRIAEDPVSAESFTDTKVQGEAKISSLLDHFIAANIDQGMVKQSAFAHAVALCFCYHIPKSTLRPNYQVVKKGLKLLRRMLSNIVKSPNNMKFRKIPASNQKFCEVLGYAPPAVFSS